MTPQPAQDQIPERAAMTAAATAQTPTLSHKARILLVDDEPLVLKMLHTFLESQDYQVLSASGGYQALEIMQQQQGTIDLLLTDIRMPDMNGIRLLEAVRQEYPTLPVLLMTGYSDFELVVEGLKQHAFDLLMKPIDFNQLTWCISKALAFVMTQRLEKQYRTRLEQQVADQTRLLCQQLEALQESQRTASEIDELKRNFLSLISHECRTPLNGMVGALQLLETLELPAGAGGYLSMLRTSTEQLNRLVQNLLTLVEAQATRPTATDSMTTPCQALQQLEARFSSTARSAGIELESSCSDPVDRKLYGPWDSLQIIGGCLLDNALKFNQSGSRVSCRIWTEPQGHDQRHAQVLIEVKDNGKGIPDHLQEVIFKPFTQLEHYLTRRSTGFGIGLAIVRTLCDKLGGTLSLVSKPEEGSSFTCSLPFAAAPIQEPRP
jgi:signal transduction histidine kinase